MKKKIDDFFKLNSNKDSKRIHSLIGKEVIIYFYPNKNRNTFTETIRSLIKYENNQLFLGETKPNDASPLIIDISDIKGIEECQSPYKIDKEIIGIPVNITNIYNQVIETIILKDEQAYIFIEFAKNKQSEYATSLIKNIERIEK